MLKAAKEIQGALGEDAVSLDDDDLESHSYSEASTSNTPTRPVAVIMPSSTEQVSLIAKICTKYRVPMIPFGAGSSVEGHFSAPYSGFSIDLSRMDNIIAIHDEDMDVVVQPGVNWVNLNDTLKPTGLFLPLDPSPTAHIGGMVATNCSGTNAMRYGTMKDWVVNLTVVLADGTVIKTRRRPRKTSAGYNLNGLFTGSEGTLGIITEVTLKLAIVPSHFGVATTAFPSVAAATTAATSMIRGGVALAALELMDDVQMRVINQTGGTGGKMWAEKPTLFIKFSGSERAVEDSIAAAKEIALAHDGSSFVASLDEKTMTALWSARKQALWAILSVRPEGTQIWSTDVAVPLSNLADIVEKSKSDASKLGLFSTVLGHVGDGNFHQAVMYNPDIPEQVEGVKKCVDTMVVRALEMDGTVSGEHGIGLGKKHCLEKELGPVTIDVMRTLKRSLDPHWLLNPGKILDA
ncbi:uncharacterized protein N7458_012640 [Penicillium daleae]|uniref:D-lactate dehydrogenase (cytochrome) n=1 Tax=Penicillium daleae TaxID=63821 RepID=A0AAD6FY86_9EURO|nr:uncharacterized protein N7458_012640 [Penicillium daleae]KAJ5433484.1 hypothetical protein N7458_012640 [Penicillium daleae]